MKKNYKLLIAILAAVILISLYLVYYIKQTAKTNTEIFSRIYKNQEWEKGSGVGSYPENTVEYRQVLQQYFHDKQYETIIDLGCGDWQIMSLIDIPDDKVYKGFDLVESVIQYNKKNYAKNNVLFYQIKDLKELHAGDLLIVKDVVQHWPSDDIRYFIGNILPKYKFALITNCYYSANPDLNTNFNKDIEMGGFRPVDLTLPPFNLKNAENIMEYGNDKIGYRKKIYLYVNPN